MWIFRELWDSICGRSHLSTAKSFSTGLEEDSKAWDNMKCYAQYTPAEDIRQQDECKKSEAT